MATTSELLERVDRLPLDWRHPWGFNVQVTLRATAQDECDMQDIDGVVLDLHGRHIAEKLAQAGLGVWPRNGGGWHFDVGRDEMEHCPTYAEALVAAAEEVNKQ
jgi:hypothetical protein